MMTSDWRSQIFEKKKEKNGGSDLGQMEQNRARN